MSAVSTNVDIQQRQDVFAECARQLALRGTILSILLLDLRQVLKLDRLSFEDASFHVFDKDLLFFAEEIVLELHSMDFLLHGNDFSLTNRWIKMVLHFFLKLDLSFPEKNLSFGLNNFCKDISFLFL